MINPVAIAALKKINADELDEAMEALGERVGDAYLRAWVAKNSKPSPGEQAADAAGGFRLTDLGNAERFIARHGAHLRYDVDMKQWYRYDGTRWIPDMLGDAQERGKDTIRSIYLEAQENPDEDRRAALIKHAAGSEKDGRIKSLLSLAATHPAVAIRHAQWDVDPWVLNVENGTIQLRTGQLEPHSPCDHITKLAPVQYDREAISELWDKALERWQPDVEVRSFLRRAVGYSLTGAIGEETAFFTYGSGSNGKSKFTGAIAEMMGDYAWRLPIEVLMDARRAGNATPELIGLVGARLVIPSEVQQGKRLNEAFIKDMTGGDPITARANYGATFIFRPTGKMWLYGNHKPMIRGTDDGIWRRLPLIPFTVPIPPAEKDINFAEKLSKEYSAVLAWAVRGCLEWQQMRLSPPAAVIEASAEYRQEMDPIGRFFRDTCTIAPGPDASAWTSTGGIRDAYQNWAESEGERYIPTPNALGERLRALDLVAEVRKIGGKSVRGWLGIGLLSEHSDPSPFGYGGLPEAHEYRAEAEQSSEIESETASEDASGRASGYTGYSSYTVFENSPQIRAVREVTETGVTSVTGVTGVTVSSSEAFSEASPDVALQAGLDAVRDRSGDVPSGPGGGGNLSYLDTETIREREEKRREKEDEGVEL